MSTSSNFSYFQLSGDQSNHQKDEQSYQMQRYLQADPTITERLVQSATSMKGEEQGTEKSVKELTKRVTRLERVIQGGSSNTA